MDLLEQGFKILARLHLFIGMPIGIAVSPVQGPFLVLGLKSELSHPNLNPHSRLGQSRALFVEGHAVSSESETQPYLVVEVCWKSFTAVGSQGLLDLSSGKFRQGQATSSRTYRLSFEKCKV
jgi:hypothetical protein